MRKASFRGKMSLPCGKGVAGYVEKLWPRYVVSREIDSYGTGGDDQGL
jgi:hypothetical protein